MGQSNKVGTGIYNDALVGYLSVATFCTTDLDAYVHFYGTVMKMQIEGPFNLDEQEKDAQCQLWQIPDDLEFDLYHIYRASVPSLIHMRVLHLKTPTPQIHKSYSSYEMGSFSLGFPTSDAKGMDKRLNDFNVEAMAPMQLGDIVRADGSKGQYLETIYKGPDFLHCVGIERVNVSQLAPCDPADGFGGPGYSAFVALDSQSEIDFYLEVLDHYILFDSVWETAEGSALGVEAGVPFRFVAIYAPEAKQNHILLLEYKNGKTIDTGVPSHLPNQGLGMYTFQTKSIEKVFERAESHGSTILSSIRKVEDHILGKGKACTFETPNGFYIEIFQKL